MVSSSGLTSVPCPSSPVQWLRRDDDVVPGDPVHDLHVVQVEVDRVGIDTVMGDAPDLRAVSRVGDRRDLDIAHRQAIRIVGDSLLGQVGGVDELGRRVHERVEDDVLRPGVGGWASTPRLACMRPNSSNVVEFISS